MCKLFIATGKLSVKQVRLALESANQIFQKTERDGFGFMAANNVGRVARGRYFDPERYSGYMSDLPLWMTGSQSEENRLPQETTALIVHGRTSTNAKRLENVHPFHLKGYYLAHNGIVSWAGKGDKPKAECDSEQYLQWLIENAIDWQATKANWTGWGAIALYNSRACTLTVAKDKANLVIARRSKGQGWVMATRADHLIKVCHKAGITLDTKPLSFPKRIVVFNGYGAMSDERDWIGFGERHWTERDAISFGHVLNDDYRYAKGTKWTKNGKGTLFPDYEPKAS